MPTFLGTTAGGRAISGGVLAPRSNRGSTGAVATFFLGSRPPTVSVEYILVGGGGNAPSLICGATAGGGGAGGTFTGSSTVIPGNTYTFSVGGSGGGTSSVSGTGWTGRTSVTGGGGGGSCNGNGGSGGSGGGGSCDGGGTCGDGGATVDGAIGANGQNGCGVNRGCSGFQYSGYGGEQPKSFSGTTYGFRGYGQYVSSGNVQGGAGGANTGTGGTAHNGAGGSGICAIRYPETFALASATTGSPSYALEGGYHVYRFTGTGTVTI